MDILSREADDLFAALSLITDEEKSNFLRWSQENSEFDGLTRQVLFGHPYYLLTLKAGRIHSNLAMEFIDPAHRNTIQRYFETPTPPQRKFMGDLLFFRIDRAQAENKQFVAVLTLGGIGAFCKNRSPDAPLSPAELRTLAQLLTGAELKDAAAGDGVTYETKRTQVKTINSKLAFGRQIDLVATLLSELMLEIISNEGAAKENSVFDTYIQRFAPREVRIHTVQGELEDPIKIVDLGPSGGVPLVVLYSAIIPPITDEFIDNLKEANIRFLSPMRMGALTPDAPLVRFEDHVAQAIQGIRTAAELVGATQFPIHASASLSYIALRYAQMFPSTVRNLYFHAAITDSEFGLFSSQKLTTSLLALAKNNPLTLNLVFKYLQRVSNNREQVVSLYRRALEKNPRDIAIIDAELANFESADRLDYAIRNSLQAIIYDFQLTLDPGWSMAANMNIPMHFTHGLEDQIVPIEKIHALAGSLPNASVHPLPDMARLTLSPEHKSVLKIIHDQNSYE